MIVVEVDAARKRQHRLWRARTRYRFDDGKLRQVERIAESESKAETALKIALTTIQASTATDVKRETRLGDLGERFLAAKSGRAPRTIETYERAVRKVIIPRIGDLAVSEATADRLQRFVDAIASEVGIGTAKTARAVLSGMMGLAARADAVRHNPVRELAPIEQKAVGATPIPLGDLAGILEKLRGDQRAHDLDLVDLVEFVAGTGVRISEACGLAWEDVDLGAGTATIRANAVRATGHGVIRQLHTKTDAGARRIRLPGGVLGVLGDRRVRGGPNPHGLVFPTILGNLRDPRNTARDWAQARTRLGIGNYSFHSFRKTVATALDQAGLTARDIAEFLGHADPSLTMGTYMSKTVGGSRAADALDAVLGI
ncbi:site-specific integrase [Microbacterium saperdae]|uniref:Site-specific recombinase XerD n=1 Tax=Microbacterium saperdae TaxID=69368 RepID=A0A543BR14_9MICO|nr:site-specific integrase [Microbacterium saperdae]TQL87238.1 site-specific recombinase XerD [Microbacterium saperdae]